MVTLLRDHVLANGDCPRQGNMVTQQRDHATRPGQIGYPYPFFLAAGAFSGAFSGALAGGAPDCFFSHSS